MPGRNRGPRVPSVVQKRFELARESADYDDNPELARLIRYKIWLMKTGAGFAELVKVDGLIRKCKDTNNNVSSVYSAKVKEEVDNFVGVFEKKIQASKIGKASGTESSPSDLDAQNAGSKLESDPSKEKVNALETGAEETKKVGPKCEFRRLRLPEHLALLSELARSSIRASTQKSLVPLADPKVHCSQKDHVSDGDLGSASLQKEEGDTELKAQGGSKNFEHKRRLGSFPRKQGGGDAEVLTQSGFNSFEEKMKFLNKNIRDYWIKPSTGESKPDDIGDGACSSLPEPHDDYFESKHPKSVASPKYSNLRKKRGHTNSNSQSSMKNIEDEIDSLATKVQNYTIKPGTSKPDCICAREVHTSRCMSCGFIMEGRTHRLCKRHPKVSIEGDNTYCKMCCADVTELREM